MLRSLKTLRTHSISRAGLILLALVSWFAFSNRCVLGQLFAPQQSVAVQHACCEKEHQPNQAPSKSDSQECCKGVHALALSAAKAVVPEPVMLALNYLAELELPEPQPHVSAPADTGPPGASSFSELVLHRSLRSHAPPFFA